MKVPIAFFHGAETKFTGRIGNWDAARLPHFRQIGKARVAGDPFVHAGKLPKIRLIARILHPGPYIARACGVADDAAAARIFRAMSADSCILSPRAAAFIFPPCPPS
jgi:hypothetical protein